MSVVVEHYKTEWPSQFQEISGRLVELLSGVEIISIEHVGSTSVPGLAAKPIIDVDIIVARERVQSAIDALVSNGRFTYMGELGIVDRHVMRDPDQIPRRNIYVCVDGAFQTRNHLGVRDTLRSNPNLRDQYGAVKLGLAAQGTNIVDYVEAKGTVIQKILKTAGILNEDELASIHAANLKGERYGAIKTSRLTIREFVMADVAPFHALESNPDVVRYQTWGPKSSEQAHEDVAQTIQSSFVSPRQVIELAVVHEQKFIGRIGAMMKRKDDNDVGLDPPHADIWFSFLPEVQGRGFATEAMEAFIPSLGSPLELEIECDPRNAGSWKMAERLGFSKISLTERVYECKGEWVDSLVYRKIV